MPRTTSPVAGDTGSTTSGRAFTTRQIVAAALAVLAAVVIAQNRERVEVSVLFFDVRAPLWLTLATTALIGALIGLLLVRRRAKVRRG